MDEQYKELINVHEDHASLRLKVRSGKCFIEVVGSYHGDSKEISRKLHELLLAELGGV